MPVRSTTGTANDFPVGKVSASGNNDGGTAIGIGNVDATVGPIKNDLAIATIADDFGAAIGSKVVANAGTGGSTTDRVGVAKAVSGGTLAFQPATTGTRSEEWVIMGVSTKIGGVANSQLTSSRTHNNGLIKQGVSDQIIASQSGTFSHPSATFDMLAVPSTQITPGFTNADIDVTDSASVTMTLVNPADGAAAVAAEIYPSRTLPGELTYHFGSGGKPTTDSYKAKNTFES